MLVPCGMVLLAKVQDTGGKTLQLMDVAVPLRIPLKHARVSAMHCEPDGTVAELYAVNEVPCATVMPLKLQPIPPMCSYGLKYTGWLEAPEIGYWPPDVGNDPLLVCIPNNPERVRGPNDP